MKHTQGALDLKWHIQNNTRIYIEEDNEEAIVYNSKSGSTHQLNRLALDVLTSFQHQPLTLNTLMEHICTLYDVEDRENLFGQLKVLITQFDAIGLIEPFTE